MGRKKVKIVTPESLGKMTKKQKIAYGKYVDLEAKIENHLDRFQTFPSREDEGETITLDMKAPAYPVGKQMDKCIMTEDEKNKILTLVSVFRSLIGYKTSLRRDWDPLVRFNRVGKKITDRKDFFDIKESEILELFGKWRTMDEVYDYIREEWGYQCSHAMVRNFYHRNRAKITELRNKYEISYNDLAVTKKTSRIERLAFLLHEITDKFSENKNINYSREIRAILDQVKKEVEGDEIKLNVQGKIDVNATVAVNRSLVDLIRKVPINNMVVAMVAAKRGLDPVKFMGQFTNSFYKNHNGFSPFLDKGAGDGKVDLPSNIIYDWAEIERKHRNDPIEEAKIIETPETPATKNKRAMLMAMLDESKEQLHKSQENVKKNILK